MGLLVRKSFYKNILLLFFIFLSSYQVFAKQDKNEKKYPINNYYKLAGVAGLFGVPLCYVGIKYLSSTPILSSRENNLKGNEDVLNTPTIDALSIQKKRKLLRYDEVLDIPEIHAEFKKYGTDLEALWDEKIRGELFDKYTKEQIVNALLMDSSSEENEAINNEINSVLYSIKYNVNHARNMIPKEKKDAVARYFTEKSLRERAKKDYLAEDESCEGVNLDLPLLILKKKNDGKISYETFQNERPENILDQDGIDKSSIYVENSVSDWSRVIKGGVILTGLLGGSACLMYNYIQNHAIVDNVHNSAGETPSNTSDISNNHVTNPIVSSSDAVNPGINKVSFTSAPDMGPSLSKGICPIDSHNGTTATVVYEDSCAGGPDQGSCSMGSVSVSPQFKLDNDNMLPSVQPSYPLVTVESKGICQIDSNNRTTAMTVYAGSGDADQGTCSIDSEPVSPKFKLANDNILPSVQPSYPLTTVESKGTQRRDSNQATTAMTVYVGSGDAEQGTCSIDSEPVSPKFKLANESPEIDENKKLIPDWEVIDSDARSGTLAEGNEEVLREIDLEKRKEQAKKDAADFIKNCRSAIFGICIEPRKP